MRVCDVTVVKLLLCVQYETEDRAMRPNKTVTEPLVRASPRVSEDFCRG